MREILFFIVGGLTMTCIMCCIQINRINDVIKSQKESLKKNEK